jgi:hypothetical protein
LAGDFCVVASLEKKIGNLLLPAAQSNVIFVHFTIPYRRSDPARENMSEERLTARKDGRPTLE